MSAVGCLNRQKLSSLRDKQCIPLSRTPDWGRSSRLCDLRNRRKLGPQPTPLIHSLRRESKWVGPLTGQTHLFLRSESQDPPPLQNVLEEVYQEQEDTVTTSGSRADVPKMILIVSGPHRV